MLNVYKQKDHFYLNLHILHYTIKIKFGESYIVLIIQINLSKDKINKKYLEG